MNPSSPSPRSPAKTRPWWSSHAALRGELRRIVEAQIDGLPEQFRTAVVRCDRSVAVVQSRIAAAAGHKQKENEAWKPS
jgi:hypothetical protein